MDMESPEEFTDSNDHTLILRRKRTKRQRPPSPSPPAPTTSTSSSGGGGCGGGGGGGDFYSSSIPSPTASSGEISTSVDEDEDEDMANCLILLAQGVGPTGPTTLEEEGTTTIGKVRFYVYECKTCNRTFPSFQALGGHRASHKKPKVEEKRIILVTPPSPEEEKEEARFNKFSPPPPLLQTATKSSFISNKLKVHECSVCGSEFSSGQALGGHMRRHRAPPNTRIAMIADTSPIESQKESDKPRKILSLDLNLPAPLEDDDGHDHIDSRFQFTPNKQGLVFSGPALVDCHY